MSLQAMQWAMSKAPIKRNAAQCRNRLVLIALADRYNDDTGVCWPSIKTISKDIGVSERTVYKAIDELEAAGLIGRGSPHWVAHLRADRRPTVWTLNLGMVKPVEEKRETDNGVSEVLARGEDVFMPSDSRGEDVFSERGEDVFTNGVKTCSDKPKENPNSEPKNINAHSTNERTCQSREEVWQSEFAEWYKDYPRKTGKGAARKAFLKARKNGVEVNTLKDGLDRSIRSWSVENRPKDKMPYPATWLNAESWDDEEITVEDIRSQQAPASQQKKDFVDLLHEDRQRNATPPFGWESRGELPW